MAICQVNNTNSFTYLTLEVNATHQPDSVYYSIWDENSMSWFQQKRYVYFYNTDKVIKEEVSHERFGDWELENKIEYSYNENLLTDKVNSWWDFYYLEWMEYAKAHLTYNTNNNLGNILNTKWDGNIADWVNDSLFVNKYNSNSLISEASKYVWIPFISDWEGSLKNTYLYDTNLLNIENTEFVWNYDSTDFIPNTKNKFIYNSNLQLSEYLQYKINTNHTGWDNYRRSITLYNSNGFINETILYIWAFDDTNFTWVENLKYSFIYDNNENLVENTSYIFDWDIKTWVNNSQIIIDYYTDNLIKSSTRFYWEYNRWNEIEQFNYYYPGYTSIDLFADAEIFSIYPNPAKEKLSISISEHFSDCTKIEIIDLKGRKVYETSYNFSKTLVEINLPKVPNGIYLLRVVAANNTFSKKIIIAN